MNKRNQIDRKPLSSAIAMPFSCLVLPVQLFRFNRVAQEALPTSVHAD